MSEPLAANSNISHYRIVSKIAVGEMSFLEFLKFRYQYVTKS